MTPKPTIETANITQKSCEISCSGRAAAWSVF